MNVGKYTTKLSEWMVYKKYSNESVKNYISYLGKFLKHFETKATKPSHNLISSISSPINNIKF